MSKRTELERQLDQTRATMDREARRLRRERATLEAALRPRSWWWLLLPAAVILLGLWALSACGAAPAACPDLALYRVSAEAERIRLRVANGGPGEAVVQVSAFALYDAAGQYYAADGPAAATIAPGASEAVELTVAPLEGERIALVMLEAPPCAPVALELDGGRP